MNAENSRKAVLCENVGELSARLERADEQLEISVHLLCAELYEELHAASIDDIYTRVCALSSGMSAAQRACVCDELCRLAGSAAVISEQRVLGGGGDVLTSARGKIAYVKNSRNNEAYLRFSKKICGASAENSASFREACEAVADGRCEYCILPIENDADGKLYSFYRMIDNYDLKIHAVSRVSDDEGAEGIVFALVSDGIACEADDSAHVRFEFSVVGEGADFLGDILIAASALGAEVYSAATLPVRYNDKSRSCYFAVDMQKGKAIAMALYLSLEYHGYTPLGMYTV